MHPLKHNIQQKIISLLQQPKSIREVALLCHVSYGTVQNIRKTHLPNLKSTLGGRPQKLSKQNKQYCIRAITSGKMKTAIEVQQDLETNLDVTVNEITVRRVFKDAGLQAMKKEKRPRLSAKNIKERLEFAKQYKDWTVEDWKHVVWSDETRINRFCSDGYSWCWVLDKNNLQEHQISQTVKHGGGSIMIWGCMTAHGPGFMCQIMGTMVQDVYISILEDCLLKTLKWYKLKSKDTIFQQDNNPKHTANKVQQWLKKRSFETLIWPAQSPDINPIEHLWAIIKRKLNEYETPPNGMIQLWQRIETIWNNIDKDVCMNLIDSMPRRIEAVLKAKGKWTDY